MSERSNQGQNPHKESELNPVDEDPNFNSEPNPENPKSNWAKDREKVIAETVGEMAVDLHNN